MHTLAHTHAHTRTYTHTHTHTHIIIIEENNTSFLDRESPKNSGFRDVGLARYETPKHPTTSTTKIFFLTNKTRFRNVQTKGCYDN